MNTLMNAVQFNFADHWNFKILPLRKRPKISQRFRSLQECYEERIQFKFDETDSAMLAVKDLAELMEMRLILDLHIARVKCFDLGWLQENFEAAELAPLSLAIAEELFPEEKWMIVDPGTAAAVVTNFARTMVFDLKSQGSVPSQEALKSEGVPLYNQPPVRRLSLVASSDCDDLI